LASTQHRLKELRTLGGGALPGQALVIFDAERGLVSQVYLCADGHAQEREIMLEALGEVEAGEVWIADRNFATAVFMHQVHASGGRFIVRRHHGMAVFARSARGGGSPRARRGRSRNARS